MSYAPRTEPQPDRKVPQESTGPIASDSLAAESIQDDGGFSENANAGVMDIKGASSTFANEDTSGASVLHASRSKETRAKEDEMGLGSDERGTAGGVKYPDGAGSAEFSGSHNADGYIGGRSGGAQDIATSYSSAETGTSSYNPSAISSTGSSATHTGSSTGVRPYVDEAPNYTADIRSQGATKPKGDNLTEGDVPKTKTFTGDVGGPHDPARVAEQKMFAGNTAQAGEGVGGIRQSELEGTTGAFDVLNSERAGKQGGIDE